MILAKVLGNWRQGNDKNDTMIRMIFFSSSFISFIMLIISVVNHSFFHPRRVYFLAHINRHNNYMNLCIKIINYMHF